MKQLPLAFPQIEIGVENPVSERFEHLLELRALWIVGEIRVEDVLNISRITCDDKIKAGQPRPFEL